MFRFLLLLSCFALGLEVYATQPLRALYVTDYGDSYHDYDATQKQLQRILHEQVNIDITLVGRKSQESLDLMRKPGFLRGYDVFIYNACFADNTDLGLLRNIASEISGSGVPTVFLHCALHNFRWSSDTPGIHGLGKSTRLKKAWAESYPGEDFAAFWKITGMDTVKHDWIGGFTVNKAAAHPITDTLPDAWPIERDERYQTQQLAADSLPLLTSGPHTIAWTHRYGKAPIFATTLGHDDRTQKDPLFAQLLGRAVLFITGHLDDPAYAGQKIFTNYSGSVPCYPQAIVEPADRDAVQASVRFASARRLPLKVVSIDKPNSYSDILCPIQGGILLNLKHLNRVKRIDRAQRLVTVEPGVTVDALGSALHAEGLTFPTTADYTGITIAGGIATAAHHSSLNLPVSMSEYVESLELLDTQGVFHRFQGDEARQYATHLGVLGVITEITLRVEPEFKLKYSYDAGSDNGLEQFIESAVRRHSYARVSWFAGAGRYVLEAFDRVPASEAGDGKNNLWSSTASAFKIVGDVPYSVINSGPRALQCTGEALRSRVWLPPIDKGPVGFAYNMLGSNCAAGQCPWDFGAKNRSVEVAIPLARLTDWMQDVRAILARDKGCFPVLGLYLRFSPAASSWMSMAYGEDTVMFEIHIPAVEKQDIFEQSGEVYDEILQLALQKYQGRPHWGKNTKPTFTAVGARYPQWPEFQDLQSRLDPQGLLQNDFYQSLKGRDISRHYPACARSHDCTCQQDSDCGSGYRCVPGVSFSEARVCRQ